MGDCFYPRLAQEAQHDPQPSRTVASGPRSQGCCDLPEPQWWLSGTSRVTAMGILEAHGDTMWSQDPSRVESDARSILACPVFLALCFKAGRAFSCTFGDCCVDASTACFFALESKVVALGSCQTMLGPKILAGSNCP